MDKERVQMKKLNSLEKKERNKIEAEIQASALIVVDDEIGETRRKSDSGFGICDTCKWFEFAKTEFGIVRAQCSSFNVPLNASIKIVECSAYKGKHQMELYDMQQIAWLIDPAKPNKVGYLLSVWKMERSYRIL